jgi:triosephosphate isomerase
MGSRRRYVIGNWKMNGRLGPALTLAGALRAGAAGGGATLVVCPPATLLAPVAQVLAGGPVLLGGQDCHERASGAFTGDISAEMLADAGCRFVILGHSERRAGHGERDETVRAKAEAALRAGLVAVICVGETLAEREAGRTRDILRGQVRGSLPAGARPEAVVVAYEPVWAIGTGKVASPEQAGEAHGWIRDELAGMAADGAAISILYGGSVKADNAPPLFRLPEIDGALVGGASLEAAQLLAIAGAAA